mgnify:CR=1 FL=1
MTIRDARPSDVAKIAALERECFSLPWPEEIIASQLSGPGKIMLAAEEEGAFAGYMGLQYVLDEGYISNVCTAPEHRRRGVASALIDEVRASNLPAIALYRGKGFVDVGVRPGYYEKPAEDAIIMNLYIRKEPQC